MAMAKKQKLEDPWKDKIELIKRTVCKGATDDELQLFLHFCQKTGLDPIAKQIYSIPRRMGRTIQVSIDGFRLIADRTGCYAPGSETLYAYDDKGVLISATSFVKKMTPDGTWHEIAHTLFWEEYAPHVSNNPLASQMKRVMLGKACEGANLRKSFPANFSGIYSPEEMLQAEKIEEVVEDKSSEIINLVGNDWVLRKKILDYYKANSLEEIDHKHHETILKRLRTQKKETSSNNDEEAPCA